MLCSSVCFNVLMVRISGVVSVCWYRLINVFSSLCIRGGRLLVVRWVLLVEVMEKIVDIGEWYLDFRGLIL